MLCRMLLWPALAIVYPAVAAPLRPPPVPARHTVSGFSSGASLALLHFEGCSGVEQDPPTALELLGLASGQGHAPAQLDMALLLLGESDRPSVGRLLMLTCRPNSDKCPPEPRRRDSQ